MSIIFGIFIKRRSQRIYERVYLDAYKVVKVKNMMEISEDRNCDKILKLNVTINVLRLIIYNQLMKKN